MNKRSQRRIMNDIKELKDNPLIEHGIYCDIDEDDMSNLYVCIIGGEDTSYYGGFIFKVTFPNNYPMEPPKVLLYDRPCYSS